MKQAKNSGKSIKQLLEENNQLMLQLSHRLQNQRKVKDLEVQLQQEKRTRTLTNNKVVTLTYQLDHIHKLVQQQKMQSQLHKRRSKSSIVRFVDLDHAKSKIKQALQEVLYEYMD